MSWSRERWKALSRDERSLLLWWTFCLLLLGAGLASTLLTKETVEQEKAGAADYNYQDSGD